MARTIIKKYDHDELWDITVVVPEEIKVGEERRREFYKEEFFESYFVPIINAYESYGYLPPIGFYVAINFIGDKIFISAEDHLDADGDLFYDEYWNFPYVEGVTLLPIEFSQKRKTLIELDEVGIDSIEVDSTYDSDFVTTGYEPAMPPIPGSYVCFICTCPECAEVPGLGFCLGGREYPGTDPTTDFTLLTLPFGGYPVGHGQALFYNHRTYCADDTSIEWDILKVPMYQITNVTTETFTYTLSVGSTPIRIFSEGSIITSYSESAIGGELAYSSNYVKDVNYNFKDIVIDVSSFIEDKYIYVWSSINYSHQYHAEGSGDYYFFGPEPDLPVDETVHGWDLHVTTDEGIDFLIFQSTENDNMFGIDTKLFKISGGLYAYMYSALSYDLAKYVYGWIFMGHHHRLVFDLISDVDDYHLFDTATYINPDGDERIISMPSQMRDLGLKGHGFFRAGRYDTYKEIPKEYL